MQLKTSFALMGSVPVFTPQPGSAQLRRPAGRLCVTGLLSSVDEVRLILNGTEAASSNLTVVSPMLELLRAVAMVVFRSLCFAAASGP